MSISIPGADYTPQLTGYTGQGAFRFWCQKVLPIVYDDSLSYYELLNKVVNYLNNVIKDVASLEDNVTALNNSYVSLQNYVNEHMDEIVNFVNELEQYMNDYFTNLDVQEEINKKLNEMAVNGSLSNILEPLVRGVAPDIITEWMSEHITPTTPVIDASLSVSGAGADAKVTGDEFKIAAIRRQDLHPDGVDFAPHEEKKGTYGGVTFDYSYNKIILSGRVEDSIEPTRLMITMTEEASPRFRAVSSILGLVTGLELEEGSMYKLTTIMAGTVIDDDETTEYNVNMSVYPCGSSNTIGRNYYSDVHKVDTLFVAPSLPVNLVVYLPKNRTYNCTLSWTLEKIDKLVEVTDANDAILSANDIDIFADNRYNRLIQDTTLYPGYYMSVACIKNTMRIDGKCPYNYLIRLNTGFEGSDPGTNFTDGINLVKGAKYRIYKYRLKGSSDFTAGPNINDINISVYPVQTPFVSNRTIATLYEYNENYCVYQFTAPAEPINVCAYIRHDIEYQDEVFYLKLIEGGEDNEDGVSDIFVTEMADTIAKVRAESTEPCLVFPFVTDIHYIKRGYQFTFNQFIQNLRYFTKKVKCDFVFNNGDAIDGDFNRQTSISHASDLQDGFNSLGTKYLFSVGNHDCNRYYENGAEIFTIKEIFAHLMSNVKPEVFNYGTNGTDFYIDFKEYGVRIVSINSTNSTVSTYAFSQSTINWLDDALDTDLTVILCTHASPVAEPNTSSDYKLHVWFFNPANINFSRAADVKDKLVSFAQNHNLIVLTGHSHIDATFVDPFAEVTFASQLFDDPDITTASYEAINGTVDGLHKAQNIADTANEDCWTVCVFKPMSKELSMIRFGAGKDQYLHYATRTVNVGGPSVALNSKLSNVIWSTSNASIATVDGGAVRAVSAGKCGIVATDEEGNREVWIIKVI